MAIAGTERIHTQTLFWLLTECRALNTRQKSELVCALFNLQPGRQFRKITCYTEYKSIDLVVYADDFLGVLENKLKASQRPNQLADYWDRIAEAAKSDFPQSRTISGIFLVLTNEPTNSLHWQTKSYADLLSAIDHLGLRPGISTDTVIVSEYIGALRRLTAVVDAFMTDHRNFPNVFTDGHKKKYEKLRGAAGLQGDQRYICATHLETVLQKAFLRQLLNEMGNAPSSTLVHETRGTAFFEIPLRTVSYRGRQYSLGFQLQGKTMKLNIGGRPYETSDPTWIDDDLSASFRRMVEDANFSQRFNRGPTHAYLSGSKYLPGALQTLERSALVATLAAEYADACAAANAWVPPG